MGLAKDRLFATTICSSRNRPRMASSLRSFSQELRAEYQVFLYYTEGHWLWKPSLKCLIDFLQSSTFFWEKYKEKSTLRASWLGAVNVWLGLTWCVSIMRTLLFKTLQAMLRMLWVEQREIWLRLATSSKLPLWKKNLEARNDMYFPGLDMDLRQAFTFSAGKDHLETLLNS